MNPGKDYIGVSAGVVIVNDEGKYFLAKRGTSARDDQNMWEFPGGTIHFYETRNAAVKRNILRKYGFEIIIERMLGIYDVIDKNSSDHWISTTYYGHYSKGVPKIKDNKKCIEIGWFTLNEIRKLPLSRITRLNVKDLAKTLK